MQINKSIKKSEMNMDGEILNVGQRVGYVIGSDVYAAQVIGFNGTGKRVLIQRVGRPDWTNEFFMTKDKIWKASKGSYGYISTRRINTELDRSF